MDAGPVFDGGLCIRCADPVLSDQEDPRTGGMRRSGIFCMTGVSTGIIPVGVYGAGGHDRDREYHRSRGGCDRGRPGAVFWMWVSAFLGMATAYGRQSWGSGTGKKVRTAAGSQGR